jgi:hypothetical protein
MSSKDQEFAADSDGLHRAVELMGRDFSRAERLDLPTELPPFGMGSTAALARNPLPRKRPAKST